MANTQGSQQGSGTRSNQDPTQQKSGTSQQNQQGNQGTKDMNQERQGKGGSQSGQQSGNTGTSSGQHSGSGSGGSGSGNRWVTGRRISHIAESVFKNWILRGPRPPKEAWAFYICGRFIFHVTVPDHLALARSRWQNWNLHELHPSQAKRYRLAIIDKFLMAKMAWSSHVRMKESVPW
jgi:hypothetical protein